ncbi:MAG: hypothetical protein ACOCRK_07885 [bacterium]
MDIDLEKTRIELYIECDLCKGTGKTMVVDTFGSLVEMDCIQCDGVGEEIQNITLFELYDIFKQVKEIENDTFF